MNGWPRASGYFTRARRHDLLDRVGRDAFDKAPAEITIGLYGHETSVPTIRSAAAHCSDGPTSR